MGFSEVLNKVFVTAAEQRLYHAIPGDHISPSIPQADFTADKCYFRVWLSDMFLAQTRVGYKAYSPIVHATCRFNYDGATRDLRLVMGPGQSQILNAARDRTVNLNYSLLGPVPYLGGDVELQLALVALQSADYGDQLLDVLGELSQLTGSGEIRSALAFVQPLKKGIEGLFGLQNYRVQLGVHDTLSSAAGAPNRLRAGYRVVMGVTDDRFDPATLWVQEGRLFRGADLRSATPFDAADYLLFSLEKIDSRGTDIPSVQRAWSATTAKALSDKPVLDRARSAFVEVVMASPDLIGIDKRQLIYAMKDELDEYRSGQERFGFEATDTSLTGALARRRAFERAAGIEDREFSQEEIDALVW
jgi:hypothetical protein